MAITNVEELTVAKIQVADLKQQMQRLGRTDVHSVEREGLAHTRQREIELLTSEILGYEYPDLVLASEPDVEALFRSKPDAFEPEPEEVPPVEAEKPKSRGVRRKR